MFPLHDWHFETDIQVPESAIVYVTAPNGDVRPMSLRRIRIHTRHPVYTLACPVCYTEVQNHCYHDGEEVDSVKMSRIERDAKRKEYLKYEIEDLEMKLVNVHQEYHKLAPEQYEMPVAIDGDDRGKLDPPWGNQMDTYDPMGG